MLNNGVVKPSEHFAEKMINCVCYCLVTYPMTENDYSLTRFSRIIFVIIVSNFHLIVIMKSLLSGKLALWDFRIRLI